MTRVPMIHWEAPSRRMSCTGCRSADTQVQLQFLTFTRYVCRTCGEMFIAATEPRVDGHHPFTLQSATTDTAAWAWPVGARS